MGFEALYGEERYYYVVTQTIDILGKWKKCVYIFNKNTNNNEYLITNAATK